MRIISTAALACHEEMYRESLENYANHELALIVAKKNDEEEDYIRKTIMYMWRIKWIHIIIMHVNEYIKKYNIRCKYGNLRLSNLAFQRLQKSSVEERNRIKIELAKYAKAKLVYVYRHQSGL